MPQTLPGTELKPAISTGINHLVLCVRDIEASDRFYTEGLGFERCGELRPPHTSIMRFYRASPNHHHHLALMQMDDPSQDLPVRPWNLAEAKNAINHYAVTFPDRDSFLQQLRYMESKGVKFAVRGDHGMTHSAYVVDPDGVGVEILYDVPAEVWEGDVDAALNHFTPIATEGPDAFDDTTDYVKFNA